MGAMSSIHQDVTDFGGDTHTYELSAIDALVVHGGARRIQLSAVELTARDGSARITVEHWGSDTYTTVCQVDGRVISTREYRSTELLQRGLASQIRRLEQRGVQFI